MFLFFRRNIRRRKDNKFAAKNTALRPQIVPKKIAGQTDIHSLLPIPKSDNRQDICSFPKPFRPNGNAHLAPACRNLRLAAGQMRFGKEIKPV